jgi:SulP family sulfate permease
MELPQPASPPPRFFAWLAEEVRPQQLLRSLVAGGLLYILEFIFAISFAALIFSGELSAQLPAAIGLITLGSAIMAVFLTLFSSFPSAISNAQDAPAAILAITAAALFVTMPEGTTAEQAFPSVVVMIVLTTLTTGLFFVVLGYFRLGGLVRYLPYPVMGGFLAATGWFLLTGGIGVMVNATGIALFRPEALTLWLPGLALALVLLLAAARTTNGIVLPAIIVGTIGLFYLLVALFRVPFETLNAQGWLLGEFPAGSLWSFPLSRETLAQTNWPALAGQLTLLLPVGLISAIALLLNASGFELLVKQDVDLNHELVVSGLSNMIASILGGLVGFQSLSLSTLNHTISGRRLPGLLMALLLGLSVFIGASILPYVPKLVLGGLLSMLGLSLMIDWVYRAWFTFPKIDFAIILLILVSTALRGFLEGVAVGLIAMIILFVVNYSRTSVVRHTLSGTTFQSRITRNHTQRATLDQFGEQLHILQLQGFIFFGTANTLFERVQKRCRQALTRFVILDFAHVSGMDSTGLLSFSKLLQIAQEREFILLLTGLPARIKEQFSKSGFEWPSAHLLVFTDVDRGVEWCEEQLLAELQLYDQQQRSLEEQLAPILPDGEIGRLVSYLSRHELAAGAYLIRQGDEPDTLFFIESGQITAQLETPDRKPVRLETMYNGRTVGELGFYLGTQRSAAVIADKPSVVYSLSQQTLAHMEQTDPEAANTLHRLIVHLLGERVIHLIRAIDALQD